MPIVTESEVPKFSAPYFISILPLLAVSALFKNNFIWILFSFEVPNSWTWINAKTNIAFEFEPSSIYPYLIVPLLVGFKSSHKNEICFLNQWSELELEYPELLLVESSWIFPFEDITISDIFSPKYVNSEFEGNEITELNESSPKLNVVHPLPDVTPELSGGVSVQAVPVPKTFSLPVVWPKSYFVLSAESGLNSKILPLYSVTVLAVGVKVCTIPGKVLGADVVTGVRVLSISNLLCGKLFFSTK